MEHSNVLVNLSKGKLESIVIFGPQVVVIGDVASSDVTDSEEPSGGMSKWSWSRCQRRRCIQIKGRW